MIPGPRLDLVNGRLVTIDSTLADHSHFACIKKDQSLPLENERADTNSVNHEPSKTLPALLSNSSDLAESAT